MTSGYETATKHSKARGKIFLQNFVCTILYKNETSWSRFGWLIALVWQVPGRLLFSLPVSCHRARWRST